MDDSLDVNVVSSRSNFAGDEDLTVSTTGFDGDASIRIDGEMSIKDGIGDLVAEFVWMFRRDAFCCAIRCVVFHNASISQYDKLIILGKCLKIGKSIDFLGKV